MRGGGRRSVRVIGDGVHYGGSGDGGGDGEGVVCGGGSSGDGVHYGGSDGGGDGEGCSSLWWW